MPDNHIDKPLASPSNEITSTRPRQESTLALLSTEILLKITGEPGKDEETLSARDFKALALSCSRLFHLVGPMYYFADNCSVLQSAFKHADVETMERCRQHGALVRDGWELSKACQCPSERPHRRYYPFDSLLECVAIGIVPIDLCIEALRWLMRYAYDLIEQVDQYWWDSNGDCHHMPELIVTLLGNSTDRARTEGICQMIRLSEGWIEEHDGQVVETLEQKLNLLIKYRTVDTDEKTALRSVLKILKEYSTLARQQGKLDMNRIGKKCWQKLVAALRPWGYDDDFVASKDFCTMLPYTSNDEPKRVHRFYIDRNWRPYTQWYNAYELQDPETRANLDRPWFAKTPLTQNDSGIWEDTEWSRVMTCAYEDEWRDMNHDESFNRAAFEWVSWNGAKYGVQDWVAPKPDPEFKLEDNRFWALCCGDEDVDEDSTTH
ncbi:hypothetical protein FHETE_2107 [Fusarium heterosporum]|uniref:Uncharacterized protein n=1 Tax=Fusarium heterosporum TaxID=42747 RepID=A0A8H5TUY7_FUSHE|nr:hypothetical protein FHETE_2107 [Fusarium heterosporum]